MLSFTAVDTDDNRLALPSPLSVVINMDEDVPADDLYAVFEYMNCKELKSVEVCDGGNTVFVGTVDEEEHIISPEGDYLRISARSLAALLLDNESAPQSYDHPSAGLIYDRHVKKYGIAAGDIDDSTYLGELDMTKGMSQWSAVESFCAACFSAAPRVSADGKLYMKGISRGGTVVFGDSENEIRYTQITESRKRCEEISRVNVKVRNGGGYDFPVNNPDAIERGICRERCINAVLTSTPIKCADIMIAKGRAKSYALTLTCPERLTDILGCGAAVHSRSIGDIEGMYVCSLRYRLDSKGEKTSVGLKRRYA